MSSKGVGIWLHVSLWLKALRREKQEMLSAHCNCAIVQRASPSRHPMKREPVKWNLAFVVCLVNFLCKPFPLGSP